MKKKGFISVPFHWLFVILAGGFIMFLFAFFVTMGLEANDAKLSTELLLHFDTIFSTLATSELTETPIKLSRGTQLRFSCDLEIEGGEGFVYSDFQLEGGSVDRNIDQFAVFTNEEVGGSSIITKTEAVNVPFTTTSALFIVDSDTRYVAYYKAAGSPIENKKKNDRLQEVMDLFPANSSKVIVTNFNGEGYKAYDTIVLITIETGQLEIGGVGAVPEYFRDFKNLRHIDIVPKDPDEVLRSGYVKYKVLSAVSDYEQFQEDYDNVSYHSPGLLLGSIISPSQDFYDCTVWKIMDTHLRVMLDLLSKKANKLALDPEYSARCGAIYSLLGSELINYKQSIYPNKEMKDYDPRISDIEGLNAQLEFESCPLIY